MEFRNLLADDDAVSPVIGVILMVAITVILAAVIGTFVLGLGDQVQQTSPTAQFSFDYDASDPDLEITHDGGDGIAASQLTITGNNHLSGNSTWVDHAGTVNADSQVTAGKSAIVTFSSDSSDNSARVVWNAEDGDRSSTLAKWEN